MKRGSLVKRGVFARAVLSGILLGISLTALSCGKPKAADASSGTAAKAVKPTEIIVGTGNGYEPYCYLGADGKLTGYELAVLEEVDRRLPQYTFKFEVYDFANILVSLNAGKIDIGAHEFEENADRRVTYLYGEEGYNSFDGFFTVREGGPWSDITSIEDLAGNPNAVIPLSQGSNYEAWVKTYNGSHEKKFTYEIYSGYDILLNNLVSNIYAGLITPLPDMRRLNEFSAGLNLKPVSDKAIIVSQTYFIFKKENTALQQAVDGALGEIKADGTLAKLHT
jgi:L-cystine transport system substrate-binding protein